MTETTLGLMSRRGALGRLGLLAGGALSASVASGLIGGCRAASTSQSFAPQSLGAEQYQLVATLSEIIIPTTDTPGAIEAGVPSFVDQMMTTWFSPGERDEMLTHLAELQSDIAASLGKNLSDATPDEQRAIVQKMANGNPLAPSQSGDFAALFRRIKELTVVGYYTSEVGATQELHVMPMGEFKGDIPYEDVGKAWT